VADEEFDSPDVILDLLGEGQLSLSRFLSGMMRL
jgi:hypothetical protein